MIKPAEAPPQQQQAKPALPPAAAPDQSDVTVFRPPGTMKGTGVFIKVPQDDEGTAQQPSRPGSVDKSK